MDWAKGEHVIKVKQREMKRKQSQPSRLPSAAQSDQSWRWICPQGSSESVNISEIFDNGVKVISTKKRKRHRSFTNNPLSLIKQSASCTQRLHLLSESVGNGSNEDSKIRFADPALSTVLVTQFLPATACLLTRQQLDDAARDSAVRLQASLLFSCEQVFLHVELFPVESESGSSHRPKKLEAAYLLSDDAGKLGCCNCPGQLRLAVNKANLLACLSGLLSSENATSSTPLIIIACLRLDRLKSRQISDDPSDFPTRNGTWSRRLGYLVQLDWGLTDQSEPPGVHLSSGRENLMQFFDQVMDSNLSGRAAALINWYDSQQPSLAVLQNLGLRSQLRPYQRLALAWCAKRELEPDLATDLVTKLLNEAYQSIRLPTAQHSFESAFALAVNSQTVDAVEATTVYYSPYHNHFVSRRPAWDKLCTGAQPAFRGGILADEMGLGKTVEMIALILAHQRPDVLISGSVCDHLGDAEFDKLEDNNDNLNDYHRLYCPCNSTAYRIRLFDSRIVVCQLCGNAQHRECVGLSQEQQQQKQCRRYLCPVCLMRESPLPGRATLFVVPPILLEQVKSEFSRHTALEDFSLTVYSGIEDGYVQPSTLANSHVVVTTYTVLQRESRFILTDIIDEKHRQNKRNNRSVRYPGHISPLTCINWWRIVLDEAQTICSSNSQLSAMVGCLSAVNRWCVTGTPVQTGLSDLHGLFQFLGAPVASCSRWFKHLLLYPYQVGRHEPLVEFTASVLWRQTKSRVADQIGIPPLSERVYRLKFNGIESHYYRLRMESERNAWRRTLDKLGLAGNLRLDQISRSLLKQLLGPLSCMRQACDFPTAMRAGYVGRAAAAGGAGAQQPLLTGFGMSEFLTMDQVLDSLIQKTRLSLKEEHRKWLMSVNGLAAIAFNVDNSPATAAQLYREALSSIAYYREFVSTDSAQELHAIHWLQEVLRLDQTLSLGRSISEDGLADREAALREHIIANQLAVVAHARSKANALANKIAADENHLESYENWLIDLLHRYCSSGSDRTTGLIDSLADLLCYDNSRLAGQIRACSTPAGVAMAMHAELDRLKATRAKLLSAMAGIDGDWTADQFRQYVLHCLRRAEGLKSCRWCSCEALFDDYKKAVYLPAGFVQDKRLPPLIDSLLTRLLRLIPSSAADPNQIYITSQLNSLKLMRREYNLLHDLWIELGRYQSVKDEIDQALTRLRLLQPGEQVDEMTRNFVHTRLEFGIIQQRYQGQKTVSAASRSQELGRLKYLINLKAERAAKAKSDAVASAVATASEQQAATEDCPVCRRPLPARWHVLACAHQLCLDCLRQIIKGCRVLCPICRQTSLQSDIRTVFSSTNAASSSSSKSNVESVDDLDRFDCYGDYSTKVAGIVRCLKCIESREPGAKVLVFSCFPTMLDLLRSALIVNGIPHAFVVDSQTRDSGIERFRAQASLTVLLLSINYGANGLNLIEANHVLLAEPQLNPAQELQAIGRVDRIGQTKPTTVHRFFVSGTIEEALWSAVRTVPDTNNTASGIANAASHMCNLTLDQLSRLLLSTDEADAEPDNLSFV